MQVAAMGLLIKMLAVFCVEGNTKLVVGIVTSRMYGEDARFTRRVRQKPDDHS